MKHILTLAALVFATSCFGQEACQSDLDINANGAVDIADFLHVLGLFGDVDSDGDGVWDSQDLCSDDQACNYQANPTEPCQELDAIGLCGGGCFTDFDNDGICDTFECGQPYFYGGHYYETVQLGSQCWFSENLRSNSYRNGDAILTNLEDEGWATFQIGAYSTYGDELTTCDNMGMDFEVCDVNFTLPEYGLLYNWYAVADDRGLCPQGWHVPDITELIVLQTEIIGASAEAFKSTSGWYNDGHGTNTSGFNGKPGGYRYGWQGFFNAGGWAYWWSSSEQNTDYAYSYTVGWSDDYWDRSYEIAKHAGLSIRCIQDSE